MNAIITAAVDELHHIQMLFESGCITDRERSIRMRLIVTEAICKAEPYIKAK